MKQQRPMLVVSKFTQMQDQTLRLLNFLLTSSEAQQQLAYYDEYAVTEDGITPSNFVNWFGLATLPVVAPSTTTEEWYPCMEDKSLYESLQVMYSEAKMAPSTGFMFNPEPVIEQIQAVEAAMEAYDLVLDGTNAGKSRNLYFWELRRLATLEDLQEAGLQDIVDEINKQMLND